MKLYQISEQLMNKILSILGSMPYAQISGIIAEIQEELSRDNEELSHKKAESDETPTQ